MREREGAGDSLSGSRPRPQSPVGTAVTHSLCVYTNTHMHAGSTAVFGQSTLVRELFCGGPLCLSMHFNQKNHFIPPPLLLVSIYGFRLLPTSWRSRGLVQISPSLWWCQIRFPAGAGSLIRSVIPQIGPDITPNVWVILHMSSHALCSFFFVVSDVNNNVTSIYSQYIGWVSGTCQETTSVLSRNSVYVFFLVDIPRLSVLLRRVINHSGVKV